MNYLDYIKTIIEPKKETEIKVSFKTHLNGGGLVSEDSQIEETVYVGKDVKVINSIIKGNTVISGKAQVINSKISGNSWIFGNAICENSEINEWTMIFGNAHIKNEIINKFEVRK